MNKIIMTAEGMKNLLAEQKEIVEIKIPANTLAIGEARAQGDLSENADYAAARNVQAELNHRLNEINNILKVAKVVTETSKDVVSIGSLVKVHYLDIDREFTLQVVSTHETNPQKGKISNVSPLGERLIGSKVNDILEVKQQRVRVIHIN